MRVGFGFDVHKLGENRKLILGGVEIPFHLGLEGHSDADVLIHAIIDAMLGASAKGDIGQMFPDSDEKYHNISSMVLLKETYEYLKMYGFDVVNIDCTIVAQNPKMAPFINEMRKSISSALNTSIDNISIKATTTDRLGFIGADEGIAAFAVANIE